MTEDETLQCSCLENAMDRGAWWVTVHGAAESRTRLSTNFILFFYSGFFFFELHTL